MSFGPTKKIALPVSKETVEVKLISTMDLVARGKLPTDLFPSPIKTDVETMSEQEKSESVKAELDFMRTIVGAACVSPKLGDDVPWTDVTDRDLAFLFGEVMTFLKAEGGLPASAGSFSDAGASEADRLRGEAVQREAIHADGVATRGTHVF